MEKTKHGILGALRGGRSVGSSERWFMELISLPKLEDAYSSDSFKENTLTDYLMWVNAFKRRFR